MITESLREQHQLDILAFFTEYFGNQGWIIEFPPHGRGQETYFVKNETQSYFVKLNAQTERYQVMDQLGLSPKIISNGVLKDGTTILVLDQIKGRKPSPKDFQQYLAKFAACIRITHQSQALMQILPKRSSPHYKDVGLKSIQALEQRWEKIKFQVPGFIDAIDLNIQYLKEQVAQFTGGGLVASHNDPCNGNWLIAQEERIYLLDYESMSIDDPALDLGALLWWYYPPAMRSEFLRIAGCQNSQDLQFRMRIRMAIHALNIIIPRENSFDRFNPQAFDDALTDFRALIAGEENPQGYYQ
jgi:thiamine kinase-like enzyme